MSINICSNSHHIHSSLVPPSEECMDSFNRINVKPNFITIPKIAADTMMGLRSPPNHNMLHSRKSSRDFSTLSNTRIIEE
jgi:hypothetical protein